MTRIRLTYSSKRGYPIPSDEEIRPLVEISEFLMLHGFTFCRAFAADGISEILHTGDAPYYVNYRDLASFRDNFVKDFRIAEEKAINNSGGWISSLNYGHVDVCLRKGDLLFHAFVGGGVKVEWFNYTREHKALIELVNKEMMRILCTEVVREEKLDVDKLPRYWNEAIK